MKGKKKLNKSSKLDKNLAPEPVVLEKIADSLEVDVKAEQGTLVQLKTSEEMMPVLEKEVEASRLDGASSSKRSAESGEKLLCAKCKAKFPSKNKLFDHLKSTGHAVYLGNKEPDEVVAPTSKKSKKKFKK